MKIENIYQRLYNYNNYRLYDELPLPIRINDDITYEYENEEEKELLKNL